MNTQKEKALLFANWWNKNYPELTYVGGTRTIAANAWMAALAPSESPASPKGVEPKEMGKSSESLTQELNSEGLKNCPFCGSNEVSICHEEDESWDITCNSCWSMNGHYNQKKYAVEAWNTRPNNHK